MKKAFTLLFVYTLLANEIHAQYSTPHLLPIPDTVVTSTDALGNTDYHLDIHEGFTQILPGMQTLTNGYNESSFLGPTLIMYKGSGIQMSVFNETNEPTTVHWHGIHLPAIMDGGPHQIIGSGVTWQPYWTVMDNAATYWYHAHLDFETNSLVTVGQAGMIIVKDSTEIALEAASQLPYTYGVDDIPVILADRDFDTATVGMTGTFIDTTYTVDTLHDTTHVGTMVHVDTVYDTVATHLVIDTSYGPLGTPAQNQFIVSETTNFQLTNGVINAYTTLPAQVVRLRILNASTTGVYNVGLSNVSNGSTGNVPFYVIASDGGLLNSPVTINPGDNFFIAPGERYEILVNLTGSAINTQLYLMAFNVKILSSGGFAIPALGIKNFPLLNIKVGSQTTASTPVTSIPSALTTVNFPDTSNGVIQEMVKLTFLDTAGLFTINNSTFNMGVNNITVPLGATEAWTVTNTQTPSLFTANHVFHIHDVQFQITSIFDSLGDTSVPIPAYEQGWKDDFLIKYRQAITFYAQFENYADNYWPYMYHCHMLQHEDMAMMAQFVVVDTSTAGIKPPGTLNENMVTIYPNPTAQRIYIDLGDKTNSVYYVTIYDALGRKKLMLPKPKVSDGIDVSFLSPGNYFIEIRDVRGNTVNKKFTKLSSL